MPPILALICSCAVPNGGGTNLPTDQTAALEGYLKRLPDWRQLQVKDCDPQDLRLAQSSCGVGFSPYYCEGDFNIDGRKDFAVILVKKAPPMNTGLAGSHQWQYKLKVVVFNGIPGGGYEPVLTEDENAPLACFLHMTSEPNNRLHYGILETCSGFIINPTKRGYRVEFPPEPE